MGRLYIKREYEYSRKRFPFYVISFSSKFFHIFHTNFACLIHFWWMYFWKFFHWKFQEKILKYVITCVIILWKTSVTTWISLSFFKRSIGYKNGWYNLVPNWYRFWCWRLEVFISVTNLRCFNMLISVQNSLICFRSVFECHLFQILLEKLKLQQIHL